MKISKYEKSKTLLFVLTMPLMLISCSGERFDTAQSTSLVLPPVIQYEREFQKRAAAEAIGGSCPAHVELGKDYKLTRDRLRIAHKRFSS